MKGYQIVEIEEIEDFLTEDYRIILIAILLQIKNSINSNKIYNSLARLEIIKVSYLGDFPAIGIQYFDGVDSNDLSSIVLEEYKRVVNKYSMFDFIKFIIDNKYEIEEISKSPSSAENE